MKATYPICARICVLLLGHIRRLIACPLLAPSSALALQLSSRRTQPHHTPMCGRRALRVGPRPSGNAPYVRSGSWFESLKLISHPASS